MYILELMKQGGLYKSHPGFTIIETMIVLSITGVLAVTILLLITAQQRRTQFAVAVNNFRQQVEQVINETTSGYFPDLRTVKCVGAPGSLPHLTNVTSTQGSNVGCIFLGKAVLFAVPGSNFDTYTTYPIAANQYDTNNQPVSDLADAFPIAVAPNSTNGLTSGLEQHNNVQNGLSVYYMRYHSSSNHSQPATDIGAFGYLSDLSASGGGTTSGTQRFLLYGINNTGSWTPSTALHAPANAVDALDDYNNYDTASEVDVCISDGGSRSALIQIGDVTNGSQAAVTQYAFQSGDCT